MNNCQIRGCRNLEYRCKDCGRVVQTIGLTDDHFRDTRKMTPESTDNDFVDANKMGWISVKERLPEEGIQVLTIDYKNQENYEYHLDYIIKFNDPNEPYIWACRLIDEVNNVSHWMPLPSVPKE